MGKIYKKKIKRNKTGGSDDDEDDGDDEDDSDDDDEVRTCVRTDIWYVDDMSTHGQIDMSTRTAAHIFNWDFESWLWSDRTVP